MVSGVFLHLFHIAVHVLQHPGDAEGKGALAEDIGEGGPVRALKDICHCRRGTAITGGNPGQVTEDGGDI